MGNQTRHDVTGQNSRVLSVPNRLDREHRVIRMGWREITVRTRTWTGYLSGIRQVVYTAIRTIVGGAAADALATFSRDVGSIRGLILCRGGWSSFSCPLFWQVDDIPDSGE